MSYIFDPNFVPQILSGSSGFSSSGPLKTWTFNIDTTKAGSASDTIILPFTADQNLTIEWDVVGDPGTTEDITTAAAATHTYSVGGIFTIKIVETVGGFVKFLKFNNGGDKAKLLDMSSLDALDFGTTGSAVFQGCSNMTISATNIPKTDLMTIGTNMFRGCTALTSVPLFNLAAMTSGASMFRSCTALTSVPLFNLAAMTNGTLMFLSCTGLTSVPLFNLAAMTNGTGMFESCTSLTTIGFSRLDALTIGVDMFKNVTLDTVDWSDLLVGVEANNVETGVTLSGGNSLHNSAGTTAIAALVARSPSWVITDGGAA